MSTAVESATIDTLLLEERRYPPPPEFAAEANAKPDIYSRSFEDFWVNYNDGHGWQDSGVPYVANKSMHYSFKPMPGISAVAQVAYIPNR